MKRLAHCLAGWICKEDDENLAIYEYGLETGLEMAVFFCIALITAFLTHKVAQIGLLLAIFGLLRSYVGGVHLRNFWSCFVSCGIKLSGSCA